MGPMKSRKLISIQVKQELIKKHEKGIRTNVLSKEYGMSASTVSTIIAQKEKFQEVKVRDKSTRVFKGRSLSAETERSPIIWIKEKQMKGDSIYEHLKEEQPSSETVFEEFGDSKGWFDEFKKRTGIYSVVRHGEAASVDKGPEKFVVEFKKLVDEKGYLPQQVFNVDETGLFWKKMPRRTFITRDEASLPGHTPMKDRLTLLLGANVSGDFRLKPMLVYHSENPRVFRQQKVLRGKLGVYWKSNRKAWVTSQLFNEWAIDVFCPTVKSYLTTNKLPLKALLLLDNAPCHNPELVRTLEAKFGFVKVVFLPPNTTSFMQPMDQNVIINFKKLYMKKMFRRCHQATTTDPDLSLAQFWKTQYNILEAVKLIVSTWQAVSTRCLNSAWKTLWPSAVHDFGGFQEEAELDKEIVSIGQSLGLEVEEEDVEELVMSHKQELSPEDLKQLVEVLETDSGEEEKESDDHMSFSDLENVVHHWEMFRKLASRHPDVETTELTLCAVEEKLVSFFKHMLMFRRRNATQLTLDSFFSKRQREKDASPQCSSPKRREGCHVRESVSPEVPDMIMEGNSPSKKH
ncbi:tigger transposable element-derived protein 1-like [Homarus americanus]|uniref:tigger transposable element-derived protein 1-like n=1 Tax=Homarus americanus TaxID=6706 RepID=UPI001C453096|nr:tigger transposable element-derived protein 1-like [Homarus americanus]XP_042242203.1 tigger transposable element-derived protein 1-like [Homarus americanus]